jgi:hypothetical protein
MPLEQLIHDTIDPQQYGAIIAIGDFNLHHPLWNPTHYQKHDGKADNLIQMMSTLGLSLLSSEGTITFPRFCTTIDLVWGNTTAANLILRYGIADMKDHASDHLPIETTVDFTQNITVQGSPSYNYDLTNWKLMEQKIKKYLPQLDKDATLIVEELEDFMSQTIIAITKAVEESTPRKHPPAFSK